LWSLSALVIIVIITVVVVVVCRYGKLSTCHVGVAGSKSGTAFYTETHTIYNRGTACSVSAKYRVTTLQTM